MNKKLFDNLLQKGTAKILEGLPSDDHPPVPEPSASSQLNSTPIQPTFTPEAHPIENLTPTSSIDSTPTPPPQ